MQAKIPPVAMNEVMDTANELEPRTLQPARNQVVACACLGLYLGYTNRAASCLISDWGKKGDSNPSDHCKNKNWIRRQHIHVHAIEANLAGQYEKIPLHDARCAVT